jgi:DNA-binding CsgD family transcriptional regulator
MATACGIDAAQLCRATATRSRRFGGSALDASERRSRIVADILAEAIDAIQLGEPPTSVIPQRLRTVLRADVASYAWMDMDSTTGGLLTWPKVADVQLMIAATLTTPHLHPVLSHWSSGYTDVAVMSELVTDWHAWRSSEGYSLLRRGIGSTEIGGIRLDDGRHRLRMMAVARDIDFTRDEVQLLRDLQRPTMALCAHADWVARVRPDHQTNSIALTTASETNLTDRELEVLQHLATGILATTIATRMRISARTVQRHLANIYRKLGTKDRLTTVLVSQRAGLLLEPAGDPGSERLRSAR